MQWDEEQKCPVLLSSTVGPPTPFVSLLYRQEPGGEFKKNAGRRVVRQSRQEMRSCHTPGLLLLVKINKGDAMLPSARPPVLLVSLLSISMRQYGYHHYEKILKKWQFPEHTECRQCNNNNKDINKSIQPLPLARPVVHSYVRTYTRSQLIMHDLGAHVKCVCRRRLVPQL